MHLYTEKISSPRNLIMHVKMKGRKRVERKLSRRCREEFRLFGVISRRRPRHMLDHRSIHKYLSDERNEVDEGGRGFTRFAACHRCDSCHFKQDVSFSKIFQKQRTQ